MHLEPVRDEPMVWFLQQYWPALAAMGTLIVGSAFFSSSEAAYFYLDRGERRRLASTGRFGAAAARLLRDPERLLTAVLFWNLVINVAYFAIVSIVGLRLEDGGRSALAGGFSVAALMILIVFSEMLPKSIAVLNAPAMAAVWSLPLTFAVKLVDPILPWLRTANLLSRRLLWPSFKSETHLRASDLQRAVRLSTSDAALLKQEQQVLEAVVYLSEIRAEELMRPRTRLQTRVAPVHLKDLAGSVPPSGYLLIRERETDEIVKTLALHEVADLPDRNIDRLAEQVVYVPWCVTVANALETMRRYRRRVAVVINEYGETIGILTFDDILDTLFGRNPSRTKRLLDREPVRQIRDGVWHAPGITILKRVERHLGLRGPRRKSVTITGILQEKLERIPVAGDACDWGPFHLEVIEEEEKTGQLLVEITLNPTGADHPTDEHPTDETT